MKMLLKSQLQKLSTAGLLPLTLIGGCFCFLLLLSGCGGGGDTAPPAKENVQVKGAVVVDADTPPVAGALCRFVDSDGVEQAVASADEAGVFTLEVPADIEGHIHCSPTGLDNLSLSAWASTQGAALGDTLEDEDVTIYTTLAAQIMATEELADPAGRNAELLAAMDGGQDLELNQVVGVATRLYSAMLDHSLDVTFAGDAGGTPTDGNGISGQVDAGSQSPDSEEASVLVDAQCTFIADNNLGDGGSLLYPSALADFYDDGRLSRSDLADIHTEINEQNIGQEEAIADAFKQVFGADLGPAYTTTTDADGIYSMTVPPNVSGYVRCVPRERQTLVLAAYVPGRPKGESLEGLDVNPATTLHAQRIAARLGNLAEQQTTKENYLKDISGLETEVLYDDQAVSGFQLRSGTAPEEKNVGLAAFSATALYNLLYRNNIGGDYLALLDAFCRERGLDPETFAAVGLTPEEARAFSDLLDQAIAQTQSTLGTLLDDALSTARINVTVSNIEGGHPLAGATVTLADDMDCSGCSDHTNAHGGVSLTVAGLTDPTREITIVARDAEGNEAVETVKVVPLATVETEVAMSESHTLTIQPGGNGSGDVYITGGSIACRIDNGHITTDYEDLATCSAQIPHGATVTLNASPFSPVSFDGWQGTACNHTDLACTVTMDQDHTITASFSNTCSDEAFRQFFWPRWGENFASVGGRGAIDVDTECDFEAHSDVDWISLGTGFNQELGALAYTVAANPDPNPRTGIITVFEHPVVITQDGRQCTAADYEITPVSNLFSPDGGTGTMEVNAPEGCTWHAVADSDWVTITSGVGEHQGSGTLTYTVPENPGANQRSGDINLFGKHHVVAQGGVFGSQDPMITIQEQGDGSGNVFSKWYDISHHPGYYDFHFNEIECRITNGHAEGKCYGVFRRNTTAVFWAEPDDNSIFVNWTGACTGSEPYCYFRVSEEIPTVGARFMRSNGADLRFVGEPWWYIYNTNVYIDETFDWFFSQHIKNQGIENSGPFSMGFYLSLDQRFDETDILIESSRVYVEGLAAGEEGYVDLPLNSFNPAGLGLDQAFMLTVIDDLNQVTEDVENNNVRTECMVHFLTPEQTSREANK